MTPSGGAFAVFMILSMSFDLIPFVNEMHFLAKANWLFVISIITHVIVSLATGLPDQQQVLEYTYKKEMFTEETEELDQLPWYKNYRYLSILLLIVTAVIVIWFW